MNKLRLSGSVLMILICLMTSCRPFTFTQIPFNYQNSLKSRGLQGNVRLVNGLKRKYIYNEAGNEVEQIWRDTSGVPKIINKHFYDKKGRLIKIERYRYNRIFQWTDIGFEKENEMSIMNYLNDSSFSSGSIILFDNERKPIEVKKYNPISGRSRGSTYKYDKFGNLVEVINSTRKVTFTINRRKRIVREDRYYPKRLSSKYEEKARTTRISTYNKHGFVIKIEQVFKNTLEYIRLYDKRGNNLRHTDYDDNGKITYVGSTKYTFDKNGNWIKRLYYENGIVSDTSYRKIEYFD